MSEKKLTFQVPGDQRFKGSRNFKRPNENSR